MTSTDTVERVAKAMAYAVKQPNDACTSDDEYWLHTGQLGQETWKQAARAAIAAMPSPDVGEAVKTLSNLPPEELRPILSVMANNTPNVVYYPTDFLSNIPDKEDGRGVKMGREGQAAMLLANACAHIVDPGGEIEFSISGVSHGNIDNGDWLVKVLRALPTPPKEDKADE